MNDTPATTRFRLLRTTLARWIRPRSWRLWLVLAVFLGGAGGFTVWHATSFDGLPDVGDPFDLAEFLKPIEVPDSENAFVLHTQAHTLLGQSYPSDEADAWWRGDWSRISPELRAFFTANRPALDVWRKGSDRPKALYYQNSNARLGSPLFLYGDFHAFTSLALLEGSRLESAGDMEAAWGWYRAILRSSRHLSRGFYVERVGATLMYERASELVMAWATDRRVDRPQLRRALDEVLTINAMTPPNSEALKREYWYLTRDLDEMHYLVYEVPTPFVSADWFVGRPILGRAVGAYSQGVFAYKKARVAWSNDRERSRRILRLVYANWLAHVDKAPKQRAKIAVKTPLVSLYGPDPAAPFAARAIAPEKLARALENTVLAKLALRHDPRISTLSFWGRDARLNQERRQMTALVVTLAEQLYRREHGALPRFPQDLVGSYLKELPTD